jgi:hypothetical protein
VHPCFTQISAVRQDVHAQAHPLLVEQPKTKREQGHYLNPELYGATAEQRIVHARFANSRHKKETIEDVGTALKQAQNRSPKISKMEGLFKEGPL